MQNRTKFILAAQGQTDELIQYLHSEDAKTCRSDSWTAVMTETGTEIRSMEDMARAASAHIPYPIVYIGYEEKNVLALGASIMGFTVFRHVIGNPEQYGLKEAHVQSRVLCEILKVQDIEQARKLVRERDVDKALIGFTGLLGIPVHQAE